MGVEGGNLNAAVDSVKFCATNEEVCLPSTSQQNQQQHRRGTENHRDLPFIVHGAHYGYFQKLLPIRNVASYSRSLSAPMISLDFPYVEQRHPAPDTEKKNNKKKIFRNPIFFV